MINMEKWVWFSESLYKGSRKPSFLLSYFSDVSEIFAADREALAGCGVSLTEKELSALTCKNLDRARKIISDCERAGIRIIPRTSPEYPQRLLEIPDAPILLYAKGKPLSVDDEVLVAVVGTRKASAQGQHAARKLSSEIAEMHGVIVSGMARGIDGIAMSSALDAKGYVIGVLGCGLDICYPRENRELMKRVQTLGTLISEYPPKTKPDKMNFPVRNRILSGIALGTVVIEAPQKSGALITARLALEQNRDVFAVPSGIFEALAAGSNSLIREGAIPVMSGRDVLLEYASLYSHKINLNVNTARASDTPPTKQESECVLTDTFLSAHSPDEQAILKAISKGSMRTDEISHEANMPMAKALSLLTLLEIRGSIKQLPGSRFEIKNN